MNDKELLELAAKAAGYNAVWNNEREGFWIGEDAFTPLTDDGDALRLAVKLGMNVDIERDEAVAYYAIGRFVKEEATMGYGIDEATRRAIVRAAAEVGKEM